MAFISYTKYILYTYFYNLYKCGNVLVVCGLSVAVVACGGSQGGVSGTTLPANVVESESGNASILIISPKVLSSLSNMANYGYIVVQNTGNQSISDITYSITNTVGSAGRVTLESTSTGACRDLVAGGECTFKAIVPPNSVSGSFRINTPTLSAVSKSLSRVVTSDSKDVSKFPFKAIGIQQELYNTVQGVDGLSVNYPSEVSNTVGSVLISGTVLSSEVGDFNTVIITDANGKPLPNQHSVSGNLGRGLAALGQGSSFAVLLQLSNVVNTTQVIRLRLSFVDANGVETNVQTGSNTGSITVVSNQAVVDVLPSNIILTPENPSQIITIYNSGSLSSNIKDVVSQDDNLTLGFLPDVLARDNAITFTLSLKNSVGISRTSHLTLYYNNGGSDFTQVIAVNQILIPEATPNPDHPISGLMAYFTSNNIFYKTSHSGTVTRQLILTNTGNTNETGILFSRLPDGFSVSSGISLNPCIVSENKVSNILTTSGSTQSCDVTVSYDRTTVVDQTSSFFDISYNYNNGQVAAPMVMVGVTFKVSQATANLEISPMLSADFGSILNNNESTMFNEFVLTNTGDAIATNIDITNQGLFSGMHPNLFMLNPNNTTTCTDILGIDDTCEIDVVLGPVGGDIYGEISAELAVNYVPYNEASSGTTNSILLTGFINTLDVPDLSIIPAVSGSFAAGTGVLSDPYQQEVGDGKGSIEYWIINNSLYQPATNFYVSVGTLPSGWTILENQCGTIDQPVTLLPNNGSCRITINLLADSSGEYNLNANVFTLNWTDFLHPNGETRVFSGVTYVNVYIAPSINVTTDIVDNATVQVGESFVVTATLSGGFAPGPDITIRWPDLPGISYNNNNCIINSSDPICVTSILIQDSSAIGTYAILPQPIGAGIPIGGYVSFNVIPPALPTIFITADLYPGDLGGVTGADQKCRMAASSVGSQIDPRLVNTFKALLVDSTRYPCDASGFCGESASRDWPLTAGVTYYSPDGNVFNTVNSNFVFSGFSGMFKDEYGILAQFEQPFWMGIQSVMTDSDLFDIAAWANVDVNPMADMMMYQAYSPSTCNDFTSNSELDNGTYGRNAAFPFISNQLETIIPNTWGNYYYFDNDATSQADVDFDQISNMWSSADRVSCNTPQPIVCVSQ